MNSNDRKLFFLIVFVSLLGLVLLLAPIVLVVRALTKRYSHGQVAIPTAMTAYSETNLRDERLRFFHRTMVEAYRKVGRHDQRWDAAALRYLEACSRSSASMPDAQTLEALAREGKALVDSGCTDPMVEYNCGLCLFNSNRKRDARPYFVRAIDGFKICRYPRKRIYFAPQRLAQIDRDALLTTSHDTNLELSREQIAMKSLSLQWLGESLWDGCHTNSEQRLFFDLIDAKLGKDFTAHEVVDKLHGTSGADPYLLNVFEGRDEFEAARYARGNSRALRKQHLTAARMKFTAAWKLHPELPEAPSAMIRVAMLLDDNPGETVYTWFNRAVSAQMDYVPAYTGLLWARRPRCGGSYEEMYRVGLTCLETRRFDTCAPEGFFNAVRLIGEDACRLAVETIKHGDGLIRGGGIFPHPESR